MQNKLYSNTARAAFYLLLFFTIWGTSLPFQPRVAEIDEANTSNILNQLLFSFLFLVSIIVLFPRKKQLFDIIKKEKFLFLFVFLSLLSILWSDYGIVTFKHIFRICVDILTCISFLLYTDSTEDILKPFKHIFYPYIVLTLIAILIIPGAKDPQFYTWRGFTSHKNLLGQVSLVSIFICLIIYKAENSNRGKIIALILTVISIVLLIGAYSSTSIITFGFLVGITAILFLDSLFEKIGIRRAVSITVFTFIIILIIGVIYIYPEYESVIPGLFGKDLTLTGRTEIWEYLTPEVISKPLLGVGYDAFWVKESPRMINMYEHFFFYPGQAHNGYLDILLHLGFVGLSIVLLMFFSYMLQYIKTQKPHPWIFFILITIMINFLESTILRVGRLINTVFIFSYLMPFISNLKTFYWDQNDSTK